MIFMPQQRLVFVKIARAASGSLSIACLDQPDAFYLKPHHRALVPMEYRNWGIFIVIRNPLHRFVSLWRNFGWNGFNKLKLSQSFPDFMAALDANVNQFATMSLSDYVDISNANIVLRYEELPDCLSVIPFIEGTIITHRHKSKHPIPAIPKRTLRLITTRYAEDFKRFGYEPCMS